MAGANTLEEIAEWSHDAASEQLASCEIRATQAATIARVFHRMDTHTFELLSPGGPNQTGYRTGDRDGGQEVRGAMNAGQDRMHLLAAVGQNTGTVWGQAAVGAKTNEFTLFFTLLYQFRDLKGKDITTERCIRRRLRPAICMLATRIIVYRERQPAQAAGRTAANP